MENNFNNNFDFFYENDTQDFVFYKIPKKLFTDNKFKNVSCEAKTLYGLLLDRMSLSAKNGWYDENGRVYIFFTIEDAMKLMNIGKWKAVKLFAELDSEKGCGLIYKKIQGFGKPAKIYVLNLDAKRCEKQTSRSSNIEPQEVRFPTPNNTDINNNNFNNNYVCSVNYPILSNHKAGMDAIDKRNKHKKIICDNITYGNLVYKYGAEAVNGIVEIMVDTVVSKKDFIVIGGEYVAQSVVKEKFLKLDNSHIEYVLDCFNANNTKVRNIKSYLLTSLYNAYSTIDHYYTAEANYDFR